jgi:hypothetical protein
VLLTELLFIHKNKMQNVGLLANAVGNLFSNNYVTFWAFLDYELMIRFVNSQRLKKKKFFLKMLFTKKPRLYFLF